MATTSLVGDVVRAISGDHAQVTVLIPIDVDEHAFEPTARDLAAASDADLIFVNGAGLEPFLTRLIENAGAKDRMIEVSEGITLLEGAAHEEGEHAEEDEHAGEAGDPHVWTDPNNVKTWVDNIERALVQADPENSAEYRANAEAYRKQLTELDAWVKQQVDQIPQERRKLVTDHTVFTYFANRYGFEQVGAVIPGYSTAAAPSAQELGALEDKIRELGVPVIFVGSTVNPALAQRVADDTGTRLVPVLTGSLTKAGGEAPTYLEYIRYNVNAMVTALK
jgi:ABC-type Zn uptake system ZnuABC Zn-binding protein ZnuA